jgi:hypothetical protein
MAEREIAECPHSAKLDADYFGRYCIYCGAEVAKVDIDAGQLVLISRRRRKHVAVVLGGLQKIITRIDFDTPAKPKLIFGNKEELAVDASLLMMAFQGAGEILKLEKSA